MGEPQARFGLRQLVVWVVLGFIALSGYAYRIDEKKADKDSVARIEQKIDRLIEFHVKP